jgi:hypothetical protein
MSTTAELIASAADLWGTDGHVADPLAALVRASNLLGADRAVSNFGGGNTSAKGSAVDHTGNERSVMWVKGSGSDLATIGPAGFTVLRLQEVLPIKSLTVNRVDDLTRTFRPIYHSDAGPVAEAMLRFEAPIGAGATGKAALASGDMNTYRIYNADLHAAILRAARNSYLSAAMGQVSVQNQMLVARTIRVIGRPSRAIEEHARLIRLLANRDSRAAQRLMEQHILGALQDILRYVLKQAPPE